MLVHLAIDEGDAGMRIVDVWKTQQAFETFRDERLLPVIQTVLSEQGLEPQGPPSYGFSETHHLVTP